VDPAATRSQIMMNGGKLIHGETQLSGFVMCKGELKLPGRFRIWGCGVMIRLREGGLNLTPRSIRSIL
jgi:hypothetical protein